MDTRQGVRYFECRFAPQLHCAADSVFDGLAAGGGKQSMAMIASGMKEALFTTLTGLVIALPGMFMALIVRERRNKIDSTLAQLQSSIVTTKFRNV
ncbi:MAG: MotA/TolQ/ExbB proton channel family protein [Verrucomicrobiaceae bacterium]|nr:MotA/TolQ/ExbB proton channel family protein [Verrucomicrobiaceae bacterium]